MSRLFHPAPAGVVEGAQIGESLRQEQTPEARAATGAIATALTEQGEILSDHTGV